MYVVLCKNEGRDLGQQAFTSDHVAHLTQMVLCMSCWCWAKGVMCFAHSLKSDVNSSKSVSCPNPMEASSAGLKSNAK